MQQETVPILLLATLVLCIGLVALRTAYALGQERGCVVPTGWVLR